MRQTAVKLVLILASGAGIGFSPWIPGTLGTLVAVPLSLAVNRLSESQPMIALFALVGLTVAAVALAEQAARLLKQKDPQIIVIDEISGFALANFLTDNLTAVIIAFVLFRIFDIAKVFPAARLERLPGGLGIVADDVMAGLYTFMILRLLSWLGFL